MSVPRSRDTAIVHTEIPEIPAATRKDFERAYSGWQSWQFGAEAIRARVMFESQLEEVIKKYRERGTYVAVSGMRDDLLALSADHRMERVLYCVRFESPQDLQIYRIPIEVVQRECTSATLYWWLVEQSAKIDFASCLPATPK